MPATRPVTSETSDPTEGEEAVAQTGGGIPFTMNYDKLVIAVGAYSQSESFLSNNLSVTRIDIFTSI